MAEYLSEDSLLQMNLTQLRAYAKSLGVTYVVKKQQPQLLQEINDIQSGVKQLPAVASKRGRPKKEVKVEPVESSDQSDEQQPKIQPTITENKAQTEKNDPNTLDVTGILEVMPDGYGFLRTENYHNSCSDVYVPPLKIKQFALRSGDKVQCKARIFSGKQAPSLVYIFSVNDVACDKIVRNVRFEDLVSKYPTERLRLERERNDYSLRLIDLVAPIGKGQRGLIVAAPKTGKTILLKKIAQAVRFNHPDVHLIVLLVDERPEEVTDFQESVDCEVVYSTFDQSPEHHIQVADLVIRNAKRRVEQGQDVMILLDSITRLGRAYNQTAEQSGRTLTGGLDVGALQEPKKFFGAGRNISGKGSLTILATALIDTGSKMDDIIYEEFKGTGNMEIHLDRKMSEKRIFPAIDIAKSGTRREELLLSQKELEGMWLIRKALSTKDTVTATEELLDLLMTTDSNDNFLDLLKIHSKGKRV